MKVFGRGAINIILENDGKITVKTLSFLSGEFDNTNNAIQVFDPSYTENNGLNLSCKSKETPVKKEIQKETESPEIKKQAIKEFKDLYKKLLRTPKEKEIGKNEDDPKYKYKCLISNDNPELLKDGNRVILLKDINNSDISGDKITQNYKAEVLTLNEKDQTFTFYTNEATGEFNPNIKGSYKTNYEDNGRNDMHKVIRYSDAIEIMKSLQKGYNEIKY